MTTLPIPKPAKHRSSREVSPEPPDPPMGKDNARRQPATAPRPSSVSSYVEATSLNSVGTAGESAGPRHWTTACNREVGKGRQQATQGSWQTESIAQCLRKIIPTSRLCSSVRSCRWNCPGSSAGIQIGLIQILKQGDLPALQPMCLQSNKKPDHTQPHAL